MKATLSFSVVGSIVFLAQIALGGESSALGRMCRTSDVYLEGCGMQSIDTGCMLGPKTRIVADIAFDTGSKTSFTYHLWGYEHEDADKGSVDRDYEYVYLQNGDSTLRYHNLGWKGVRVPGSLIRQRVDYDLSCGLVRIYAGRTTINTSGNYLAPGTGTSTKPICLYSYCHDGNWAGGLPCLRIYSFKIYEAGTLVRDLIPYGYGAQTGMVDRCTGKIFTDCRKSSVPFKIGCDEASVISVHKTWLDTGYHVCDKTKIAIDYSVNDRTKQQRIFGCEGGDGAWCSLYCDDNGKLCSGIGNGRLNSQNFGNTVDPVDGRMSYVLDFPNQSEKVISGKKTLFDGVPACTPSKESAAPLALFCKAVADGEGKVQPDQFANVEIYSVKIWHDGQLVRNYVPRVTDNTAGLYDLQNDTFLTATLTPNRLNQLEWAGDIETACAKGTSLAANGDAYLLSHRNEAINTGYYIQSNSKMVMDFSYYNPYGTEFLMGISSYLFLYGQVYSSGDPFYIRLYADGWGGNGSSGDGQGTERRTRLEVDMQDKTCKYYYVDESATYPFMTQYMKDLSFPCPLPLSLLTCTKMTDDGLTYDGDCEVKLYSFKIYESGELKHAYYPARKESVCGLLDRQTGDFLQKARGNKDFELCGGGYEGLGQAFAIQPEGGTVAVGGKKTLKASAPGADGYQWFRNGHPIDGAVSEKLQVCWRSGVPRADTYLCVARYANWGYAESSVATVSFMRPGGVAIIK